MKKLLKYGGIAILIWIAAWFLLNYKPESSSKSITFHTSIETDPEERIANLESCIDDLREENESLRNGLSEALDAVQPGYESDIYADKADALDSAYSILEYTPDESDCFEY